MRYRRRGRVRYGRRRRTTARRLRTRRVQRVGYRF